MLGPLESETELFEKTREKIAKRHEAALDAAHYATKLTQLQQKGAETDKEKDKLQLN